MSSLPKSKRPFIGCTTYRKQVGQLEVIGVNASYTEAIKAAGGIPLLIPLGLHETDWQAIFDRVDGLLLPGGGDIDFRYYSEEQQAALRGIDDDRDRLEMALLKTAVAKQKPFLAICRGHQVLNVALGGTLWQDVQSQMPHAAMHDFSAPYPRHHIGHCVTVETRSKLAQCLPERTVPVNSIHHQGIHDLASGLVVSARADDGLIEGVEIPDHPFAVGVQWHPEGMYRHYPVMLSLFEGLVKAAANGKGAG